MRVLRIALRQRVERPLGLATILDDAAAPSMLIHQSFDQLSS